MAFSSTTQLMVDSKFRIPTSVRLDGQPSFFWHRKSGWEDKADTNTADYGADRDRQKFTFAIWLKRNKLTDTPVNDTANKQHIFEITDSGPENTANYNTGFVDRILFDNEDKLIIEFDNQSDQDEVINLKTKSQFRDTSSWYHILVAVDTTESAFANRVKLYINGTRYTDFVAVAEANFPAENDKFDCMLYHPYTYQYIGGKLSTENGNGGLSSLEANIVECYYVEDYALTPTTFGEFGKYGEFKPIKTSGITYTYQSFYHPFQEGFGNAKGFSPVTYTGNGGSQQVFTGLDNTDLVWIKRRDSAADHNIEDSNRGINLKIHSNSTAAELTGHVSAFGTDSFSVTGADSDSNLAGATYVAWCWDMGGSNATLTAGSIDTVVRANTTYGQSIVKYTGNGTSGATIAHGLGAVPDMIWVKNRDDTDSWAIFTNGAGNGKALAFDSNSVAATSSGYWNDTDPSSTLITLGNHDTTNESGADYIAYVFTDIAGYSKFAEFAANAQNVGPVVDDVGFRPAMLFVKDRNVQNRKWTGPIDSARDGQGGDNYWNTGRYMHQLDVSNTDADSPSHTGFMFTDAGFEVFTNSRDFNASNATIIYAAWADNRQIAIWKDHSGLDNHLQRRKITQSDIILDSPTNNFCTLNPLNAAATCVISEGNLKYTTDHSAQTLIKSSFNLTNKHYWEVFIVGVGGDGASGAIGIANPSALSKDGAYATWADNQLVYHAADGNKSNGFGGSSASYGAAYTTGDVIGIAVDVPSGTIQFFKNNSSQGTITDSAITAQANSVGLFPILSNNSTSGSKSFIANFGQDSSFASNKPPQFKRDLRNQAEFYYEPPAGFLALCSNNLPEPAVVPSEYFNTVLWTGNGGTNAITVGFKPDLVWGKDRVGTDNHHLFDAIRGTNERLMSNQTAAENTESNCLDSFDTNGFTLGSNPGLNANTEAHVAWNWKAGNATLASNAFTQGSIASTCSRNVEAGFSIVSYTGDSSGNATVGHGLSSPPEMIIQKCRSEDRNWLIWHTAFNDNDKAMLFNTDAVADNRFGPNAPTSTVFGAFDGQGNRNNITAIAYAFHSVDGYSKVGSYTGNGVVDGTFVYTGFRPAWVMYKKANDAGNWGMLDNTRSPYNRTEAWLAANLANAETNQTAKSVDFLSNGFKPRGTPDANSDADLNTDGGTYIYIAFAEMPFSHSNAK